MIDVRMRDDSIRHSRGFVWITWWIGRCKTIVEKKFGSCWVFHHDSDVPHLIASTKTMETETLLRRK
jgi:hypothetical protein